MDNSIAKVLTHVYELEGLLLVVDRHGSDTPAVVIDRIREKARQLAADAQLIETPQPPQPVAATPQPPIAQPEPQPVAMVPQLPRDDYDADDTWQHDNGEDTTHAFELNYTEPERATDDEPAVTTAPLDGLRVDEKLQRTLSKDLRRAFSINDRYRFRRELFSNSDAEMNDALNLIESMQDVAEAEDYFYNELGWDSQNSEVEDFMTIVRNHFATV